MPRETYAFDKVISSFDGNVYFEDGSTLEISSAASMGLFLELERDIIPAFIADDPRTATREAFYSGLRIVLKFPQKNSDGSIVTYRHTEAVELGRETA